MFLILFFIQNASAGDFDCSKIRSYHDFYECSLQKHPQYEVSKLKIKEGEALLDQSAQWQNPDLEVKSVAGKNAGENEGSTEIDLAISVSQLWVRGAKKDIGRAQKKIAEIESQENLLEVKKQLIKDLFRFRQVESELELVNEALDAFDKIKKQFRGRLARGPEQEITLNLVELATSDYELKRNHLSIEKSEITARLKGLWGNEFDLKKDYFPPSKDRWPALPNDLNIGSSFEARKVAAEAEKDSAEHSLAVRESWPTLSAGPTIERNTTGPNQFNSVGFNVAMSLPIFSQNGGGRKVAATKSEQSKLMAEYTLKKAQLEKEIVVKKYNSAVESLKKSSASSEVIKKHNKIDGLFKQGLASGGLIIEAHRQILEYTESQHEHEISAVESYVEIKALTGNDNIEEILK